MMDATLYNAMPYISGFLLFLLFRFRIYKKSISTFIAVMCLIVVSNLMYYGYINISIIITVVTSFTMIFRVMFKRENDIFVHKPLDFNKLIRRVND